MGSGKTYSIAELIIKALESGRHVVTNVPLNIYDCPNLHVWDWDYISLDLTKESKAFKQNKYNYPSGGALYVFDEVWDKLGVESKCSKNAWLMSFFREHRQFLDANGISNDIVLCSQDIESIHASLRRLFDETVLCVKPTQLGFKGSSVRYYIHGAWRGLDVPSGRAAKTKILKSDQIFFKPEIYNMYKSHKYAPDGVTGGYDKEGTVSNTNIFQSFRFKYMLVFTIIIIVVFVKSMTYLFSDKNSYLNKKDKEVKENVKKDNVVSDNLSNTSHASNNNGDRTGGMDKSSKPQSKSITNNGVDEQQVSKSNNAINISSVWRLGSVIQNKKTKEWFIHAINNNGQIKRLSPSNCTHDEFGQYECTVDNEKITKYSGGNSSAIPSIFSAAK